VILGYRGSVQTHPLGTTLCPWVNIYRIFGSVSRSHFQGIHSPRRVFAPTDSLYYMKNGYRISMVMGNILWMMINIRI